MSDHQGRRYVIVGAGAVGGSIAAELHRAGLPVVVVARGAEYTALSDRGLHYLRPGAEDFVKFPVVDSPEALSLRQGDVLVLTTKSQDTDAVLKRLAWLPVELADGGIGTAAQTLPLVTLQNSASNERTAARWFRTIYAGVLAFPVNKETVGQAISYSTTLLGLIWIGRFPRGSAPELESIADDLRSARLGVVVVEDITPYKVSKLIYNTVNVIEPLFAPSPLRDELKESLAREGWAVYNALGITEVSLWDAETGLNHDLLEIVDIPEHPRSGNSTWQSFVRGAEVETDYLNGDIVLEGRLHAIPTPANEAVQLRIRDVIAGRVAARAGDEELREFLVQGGGGVVAPELSGAVS